MVPYNASFTSRERRSIATDVIVEFLFFTGKFAQTINKISINGHPYYEAQISKICHLVETLNDSQSYAFPVMSAGRYYRGIKI